MIKRAAAPVHLARVNPTHGCGKQIREDDVYEPRCSVVTWNVANWASTTTSFTKKSFCASTLWSLCIPFSTSIIIAFVFWFVYEILLIKILDLLTLILKDLSHIKFGNIFEIYSKSWVIHFTLYSLWTVAY